MIYILVFFIGSIPTAYWLAKTWKGIDIRQQGSGNVGATNAFRVLGKKAGAIVFIVDFLKGALPVLFLSSFVTSEGISHEAAALALGLAAMLGHIFTPFLNFKGGKGVATGAGVLAAGFFGLFLIVLGVWGIVFLLTRIVSVSSLISVGAAAVIATIIFRDDLLLVSFFWAIFLLLFWTHRSNVSRLLSGKEPKIISRPNI